MSEKTTSTDTPSRVQAISMGMFLGMRAWVAYWAIETSLITSIRWLLRRHIAPPLDPVFAGLLLLIYLCAGALFGVLYGSIIAVVRPTARSNSLVSASTLSVLIAFGILTRRYIELPTVALFALLIPLCIVAGGAGVWSSRLGVFRSPWICSLLTIGACLVQVSGKSRLEQAFLLLGYATLVASCGVAIRKFWRRPPLPMWSQFATTFSAAMLLGGFTCLLTPTPIVMPAISHPAPPRRPNLILIVLDTVRADHLSIYGYGRDTTPELRTLARQATLYTHSYSTGDMSLMSHASLFTGLYPIHHGANYTPDFPTGRPLADKYQTIAELLVAQGYDTLGIVANDGFVSQQYGLSQGFALYDQRAPRAPWRSTPVYTLSGGVLAFVADKWDIPFFQKIARTAEEINQCVSATIPQNTSSTRPFFLFINYVDAHGPYLSPPPYGRLYPGSEHGLTKSRLKRECSDLYTSHRPLNETVRLYLISQYDGAITYLDAQLGRLFAELKRRGIFDNSMIVVTSDHGEAFGEHDILGHAGKAVYQSQIYVPLLVKYPHQESAAVVDTPVSGVDILPTVMDVFRFPTPQGLDGRSLLHVGTYVDREVLSASYPGSTASFINAQDAIGGARLRRFKRTRHAILIWPFKLIRPSAGASEMYDLSEDPDENRNIYNPQSALAHRLDERLSVWLRSSRRQEKSRPALDQETLQRLRSLAS